MRTRNRIRRRRLGLTATETALVFAGIALIVIVTVQSLGTATRDDMNQTAAEVGDPTQLIKRFGNNEQK